MDRPVPAPSHSLLKRQLRRHPALESGLVPGLDEFLALVDQAYRQADADRGLLERSLELSSDELLQANSELRAIVQSLPDLFFVLDESGRILDCKAGSRTDLFQSAERLIGRRFQSVPDRRIARPLTAALEQAQKSAGKAVAEYSVASGGSRTWYEARILPLREGQFLAVVRNITRWRRAEETIRRQAHHDALTGLPNRALFRERLDAAICQARRFNRSLAVLFVDLDRFKKVNDSLGHGAGDCVLAEMAQRLRQVKRASDTVARLGGDEFVFVAPDLLRPEHGGQVAKRALEAIAEPLEVEGQELRITASAGVSLFPDDGQDAEALLRHADTALYQAKMEGRARYRVYGPRMDARTLDRLSLEKDLRAAVAKGELELRYQPMVCVASGKWTGCEALLRWRRGDRVEMPADFVPVAEEMGTIRRIGAWVLDRACAEAARLRAEGWSSFRIAVNLSPLQIEAGLRDQVAEVLDAHGLDPEGLELELTEGALARSQADSKEILERLRGLGVTLALDDFGTGHGSLLHLKQLPISTLKVDRHFTAGCTEDPRDAAIVGATLRLARGLGLRTVGEGIETPEQAAFLEAEGCQEMQGFLFAEPLEISELEAGLMQNGVREVARA